MKLVRHSKVESFRDAAQDFLLKREATHNLILGLTSRLIGLSDQPDGLYLAHVEDDSGTVVTAAMRTSYETGLLLSAIDDLDSLELIEADVAQVYDHIPVVLGSEDCVTPFARLWANRHTLQYEVGMEQGIYKLERVIPVQSVRGEYCAATQSDRELIADWFIAFSKAAMNVDENRAHVEKVVDEKLQGDLTNCIRLWWDEGRPVSVLTITRPTPNGLGLTRVYTPPEYRRNGYGSALTAAASQEILDSGRKFCFLYTDMANPTSNKIYQNIGYEFVCLQHQLRFYGAE